jgi:hypothetical protein
MRGRLREMVTLARLGHADGPDPEPYKLSELAAEYKAPGRRVQDSRRRRADSKPGKSSGQQKAHAGSLARVEEAGKLNPKCPPLSSDTLRTPDGNALPIGDHLRKLTDQPKGEDRSADLLACAGHTPCPQTRLIGSTRQATRAQTFGPGALRRRRSRRRRGDWCPIVGRAALDVSAQATENTPPCQRSPLICNQGARFEDLPPRVIDRLPLGLPQRLRAIARPCPRPIFRIWFGSRARATGSNPAPQRKRCNPTDRRIGTGW